MGIENEHTERSLSLGTSGLEEGLMVRRERWEEIQRLRIEDRLSVSEISRRLGLDRKTVRKWLRQRRWEPYRRPDRSNTLLAEHAEFLKRRAPQVHYSARILFQELKSGRGYRGSYDTVKLFVRPLRAVQEQAERALTRFETAPGHQSQVDWGVARVYFRHQAVERHFFVLTLGFSRRGFYRGCPNEQLPTFLDCHEQAFEYFGGRTAEILYDRPRTVCHPGAGGRYSWNATFKSFADFWGFEPRLCRPYRAQTKGKVESAVKYVKRNFLPGRSFIDDRDFDEQLLAWMSDIADVRIHGTTHERPIDRFAAERASLVCTLGHPSFRHEARLSRIVADDYLVSLATNRYSVPFALIGKTVEVLRRDGRISVFHHGELVAEHAELTGKYQMSIQPEHGPGAIARNARQRRSEPAASSAADMDIAEVQIRDLSVYDRAAGVQVQP